MLLTKQRMIFNLMKKMFLKFMLVSLNVFKSDDRKMNSLRLALRRTPLNFYKVVFFKALGLSTEDFKHNTDLYVKRRYENCDPASFTTSLAWHSREEKQLSHAGHTLQELWIGVLFPWLVW